MTQLTPHGNPSCQLTRCIVSSKDCTNQSNYPRIYRSLLSEDSWTTGGSTILRHCNQTCKFVHSYKKLGNVIYKLNDHGYGSKYWEITQSFWKCNHIWQCLDHLYASWWLLLSLWVSICGLAIKVAAYVGLHSLKTWRQKKMGSNHAWTHGSCSIVKFWPCELSIPATICHLQSSYLITPWTIKSKLLYIHLQSVTMSTLKMSQQTITFTQYFCLFVLRLTIMKDFTIQYL